MPEAALPNAPETFTIRPTLKPAAITLAFALACIGLAYWAYFTFVPEYPGWTPVLSFVTLAPAVLAWIDSKRISLSFDGEELRLQSGLFARQTKSLDIRLVRARARRTDSGATAMERGHAHRGRGLGRRTAGDPRRERARALRQKNRSGRASGPETGKSK